MGAATHAASVAVHRLNTRHRDDITGHLTGLPAEDRRLRFGQHLRDEGIAQYVSGIDFARDRVFGVHSPELELIGVAHLALDPQAQVAELGLSVDPSCRGKGYGFTLLQRAVLHAANLGYRVLFMVCLAENGIMMHLARKAGLTVVVEHGEADARLTLSRSAHGGAMKEAMADQFALVDLMLKQQYLWLANAGLDTGIESASVVPSVTEAVDGRRESARAAKAAEGKIPQHT
jgi:RimJ/RimL family protein N-acetyltransferase